MKTLQSSLIRAIVALIVGVLLIKYREQTVTWITISIGVLFFLSGVISCATYFVSRRKAGDVVVTDASGKQVSGFHPQFPIVGLGSIILGAILALMPTTFVAGLMYIFAAILILGALNQFFNLAAAAKWARVGLFYWLLPSVVLLVGIVAIVRPSTIASAPLFFIGWCMLLYGLAECINVLKIYKAYKLRTAAESAPAASADTPEVQDAKAIEVTGEE